MGYWTITRLAAAQGVRPRAGALPTFEIPGQFERELFKIYEQVCDGWWIGAKQRILPAYVQGVVTEREAEKRMAEFRRDAALGDDVKEGTRTIEEVAAAMERLIVRLNDDFESWAVEVEKYHREKFAGAAYTATGVDLTTVLSFYDVGRTVGEVVERNMALIRNVSDQTRGRVADIFFRNYQLRTPLREVAKQISEAVGLERDRSLRIASDQTVKLASALDEQRQREAGIDEFKWVHSGKVHYRPEHKARNGKIYKWSNARQKLKGDLPGVLPFCGCKAQAYFRP